MTATTKSIEAKLDRLSKRLFKANETSKRVPVLVSATATLKQAHRFFAEGDLECAEKACGLLEEYLAIC